MEQYKSARVYLESLWLSDLEALSDVVETSCEPDQETEVFFSEMLKTLRPRPRKMIQMWREGWSQTEISKQLGVTQASVSKAIKLFRERARRAIAR